VTGQVSIVFDSESLENAIKLLRAYTRENNDVGPAAKDRGLEALRLIEIAEKGLGAGTLVKIKTKLLTAPWASETLVFLEPTPRLVEHFATIRVGACEG
jgi:hypothetical protein